MPRTVEDLINLPLEEVRNYFLSVNPYAEYNVCNSRACPVYSFFEYNLSPRPYQVSATPDYIRTAATHPLLDADIRLLNTNEWPYVLQFRLFELPTLTITAAQVVSVLNQMIEDGVCPCPLPA